MEFLVTMTTHVPDGTSDAEVAEVRGREAQHSAGLAADGRLLRLWRPPLQPGEWRSYGLFDAADASELEAVLAGMPLRIWRTDEVTPLGAHPNDPGQGVVAVDGREQEFFAQLVVAVPDGADPDVAQQLFAQEAERAAELAASGVLLRLWRLDDNGRNLGLWQAETVERLAEVLNHLPLAGWLETSIEQLTRHPSDPVALRLSGDDTSTASPPASR